MGFDVTLEPRHTATDRLPKPEPGYYVHFRGGIYRVISCARHSETQEWMVYYVSCDRWKRHWVRPLAGWLKPREAILFRPEEPRFRAITRIEAYWRILKNFPH